ncbi:hypothetical protein TWF217_011781 [Orbilia oligospora]|nr:hypothetical protein TWF751_002073 [Orbilia oligospora]KAF3242355.1 hypothetical protein TWF217_011781 [Orbilia oligospora]
MVSQFQQTDSEKTVQERDQEFENAIQREEVSSTCDRFKFPEWLPAAIDDVLLAEDMGRCRAGILKNRDVNAFRHRGGWIQRGSWKRAVQLNLVITCGEYQLDGVLIMYRSRMT